MPPGRVDHHRTRPTAAWRQRRRPVQHANCATIQTAWRFHGSAQPHSLAIARCRNDSALVDHVDHQTPARSTDACRCGWPIPAAAVPTVLLAQGAVVPAHHQPVMVCETRLQSMPASLAAVFVATAPAAVVRHADRLPLPRQAGHRGYQAGRCDDRCRCSNQKWAGSASAAPRAKMKTDQTAIWRCHRHRLAAHRGREPSHRSDRSGSVQSGRHWHRSIATRRWHRWPRSHPASPNFSPSAPRQNGRPSAPDAGYANRRPEAGRSADNRTIVCRQHRPASCRKMRPANRR